ncbi:MAG: metal ABC transporter permease [Nitrospiraceae bacterium]|nr:metal ABC transporter permease [Nitrospiraceae bacterium]
MEALNFLVYPFLACVALVLIHAYFGIHILERGIIFVDIALAQFIGVGIALSFFFSHENTYILSMVFAVLGATILSLSKRIERLINIEAFIGVLYIFSFAVSILILDRSPHGAEEFKAILNGNILWLTPKDVLSAFILYGLLGGFHFIFRKKFFALTFDGNNRFLWEFLFFLTFALVLVKSVQMAGILQVFSFLIIPALIGRLYTKAPFRILLIGWIAGLVASFIGIGVSYKLDLPTAPMTVASLSLVFLLLLVVKAIRGKPA